MIVGVYCGSSSGHDPVFAEAADSLGRVLALGGHGIAYGGGRVGLTGRIADSCLAHGGTVHGVITQDLLNKEVGHTGLTQLEVVDTMHERKARMASVSDGFVALPGGFGTLDELCEVLTWSQLGIHHKPVVLLNTKGYWNAFALMIDQAITEGFMPASHRSIIQLVDEPDQLPSALASPSPRPVPKWVSSE